ncbi:peptidoglycan-binding protein [bacterium]|nr:peptidoglycan-binding protein [bacterium]
MKKVIIAAVVALALVAGSSSASAAAGYTFASYLKVGSTGADVTALQTWLSTSGFLSMPAGVAKGYFGQLTKAAVVKYQASVGLPATGFVGPMTIAKLNGASMTATPVASATCPAGYTCAPVGAATPAVVSGSITTPGVEGTLSVDQGAISNTTVYEGQTKVPVLNLRLRANTSDIDAQRVTVQLPSANTYVKGFSTLYVLADNGAVLASMNLNSQTVTKSGSTYSVTIPGFHYVVAKNSYRYLTVAADVYGSVNTTYLGNYTFTLPTDGVRGTDGAGIDEYSGAGFSQTVTISTSLVDSANLTLSTNSATPLSQVIVASNGSNNNEADKVTVLAFDVQSKKDSIGITDLAATTTIDGVPKNGTTTSAYLYDGSTLVANATVASNGTITFSNIAGVNGYVIPANTTKTFTLKLDIRNANSVPVTSTTTIVASGITAVNSNGSNLTSSLITGSASSNSLTIQSAGPVFTLNSKSVNVTRNSTQVGSSTSIMDAVFNIHIAAVGKSITFGTAASGTPFVKTGSTYAGSSFDLYTNGSNSGATTTISAPMTVDFVVPDSGVTQDTTNNSFTIADGQSADITVHAKATATGLPTSNSYAISVKKLYWDGTSSTWMAGLSTWRSDSVTLP